MPTYNRAHFIGESLDYIREQSFVNWECLIIDDGSTDDTEEFLESYTVKDPRIKYYKRSQSHLKGPSGCRNQGLDLARGEFVIFFDSDDIVHPENLQICINAITKHDFQFCRYDKKPFWKDWNKNFIFENDNFQETELSLNDLSTMVTMESGFACCTVMWRKNCLNGLRFNEELSYAEEWEYYTRLLSQGIKGVSINKVLYYNRKHLESNTGEFWAKDPVRRASKLKAAVEVINTLSQKGLLSPQLVQYFIRLGFFLKHKPLIDQVLKRSNADRIKRFKYFLGYSLYPLIKPIFRMKSKIIKA